MSIPRAEYPRPILVRDEWMNLNGRWLFREDDGDEGLNVRWFKTGLPDPEEIVVPFPVESEASGIHKVEPAEVVWYEREFEVPVSWLRKRIALRIGACDHWARVFVNGLEVGQHRGGYSPITFDVQHALQPGKNKIVIRVEDSLSWTQPRGKQAGTTRWPIDYDSVTGIWQTVWLEPLSAVSIESTYPAFKVDTGELIYAVCFSRQVEGNLTVEVSRDGEVIAAQTAATQLRAEVRVNLAIENAALWSPASPTLYDVKLTLVTEAGDVDEVTSYVGLREISVDNGQLCLNKQKVYLRGVLDQGYFPNGWYTAETDEDIRKDVELTLAMGLNCARKHQKAEDPRYLYWADRLGLMVWAEMPSGKIFSTELVETLTSEWIDLVKRDRGHPSVITWVPFNESWGVWHQTERPEQRAFVDAIVALTKSLDQTRPVVGNDGWEFSSGDMWTLHLYYSGKDISTRLDELIADPSLSVTGETGRHGRIGALPAANVNDLPILLTECGGVGFGKYSEEDFSYGELPKTEIEFENATRDIARMVSSANVLQGFVWTQLTDIQQEVNGLLYFDRTPKLPIETYNTIFSSIGTERE